MSSFRFRHNHWAKLACLLAVPCVLYFVLAKRMSWHPRTLRHPAQVNSTVFLPDGKTLITSCDDGGIRFWNVQNDQLLTTLKAGLNDIELAGISADGSTLSSAVAGKTDGGWTAKVWSVPALKLKRAMQFDGSSDSISISPDGHTLALVHLAHRATLDGDNDIAELKLWSIDKGTLIRTLNPILSTIEYLNRPPDSIGAVTFTPDGKTLIAKLVWGGHMGIEGENIQQWNARTGQVLHLWPQKNEDESAAVAISPDSTVLAVTNATTLELLNLQTGSAIGELTQSTAEIFSLAFSPDGKILAAGSDDKTIKLWDVQSRKIIRSLKSHAGKVYSIAFAPDGSTLATGSEDGTAKLWRIK